MFLFVCVRKRERQRDIIKFIIKNLLHKSPGSGVCGDKITPDYKEELFIGVVKTHCVVLVTNICADLRICSESHRSQLRLSVCGCIFYEVW